MKNKDESSLQNPDFAMSSHYDEKSLSECELVSILEKYSSKIWLKFKKYGYITNKDFRFITHATFDELKNSELDYRYHGEKSPEQKIQAIKMCKIVEDFLNSCGGNVKINFVGRKDDECALCDMNSFDGNEITNVLTDYFFKGR